MKLEADYVIVGAGSSGCTLAYRLTEAGARVIVIEFGGSDWGPFIQMPAALSYPMNMRRYDWGFQSEPEPGLNGRRLVCPRGKVIGGSSSINGMVYVRGHAKDYDHWQSAGAKGWSYADVLPYFKRMENWQQGAHEGDIDWRGQMGPLYIERGKQLNPLYKAFIEAGKQAGYPVTQDYNGKQQEGFGVMEHTIWQGRRWSCANAYLRPALKTGRCKVIHALAHQVVFDSNSMPNATPKAVGVLISQGSVQRTIYAQQEVILSASSINSPKLLMLSGIGDSTALKQLGIDAKVHRPGVGQNLQDHLELYIQARCKEPITLARYWSLWSKAWIGANWLFLKRGLGCSNHFESAAFIRSQAGVDYPDIQYHFLPLAVRYDGGGSVEGHGFQCHVGPMRSKARGAVSLRSNNPFEAPRIVFNYLTAEDDLALFRQCITLTRELYRQKAFAPYYDSELLPGAHVKTDAELDHFIRDHVESAYHPSGSCRMGESADELAVVDELTQVIGVHNLRVVDSSIFPRITNGNLNAPSIMVAEKAADHILGRTPLPQVHSSVWIHPHWQTKQR